MSKNKLKHFCVECTEYSALAKSNKNSPQCTALSGDKSGVKIEPNEFPATVSIACQVKLNNNFSTAVYKFGYTFRTNCYKIQKGPIVRSFDFCNTF